MFFSCCYYGLFWVAEQIDFKVKGSLYRTGYDFDIEPDSYEAIEVTIDGLEDGYHSITYILMKNSDKVPIDYLESVDLSEIYEILFDSNKDKDLKFTLYYGNAEEVPLDFYLVGLLDFKQIPLTKNEEKSFYDDLNPNEEKSIEITIDKSKLIDKKSFQLLMITSPFESVNKEQPFLFHSSMASNRVKLNNIE